MLYVSRNDSSVRRVDGEGALLGMVENVVHELRSFRPDVAWEFIPLVRANCCLL